MRFLINSLVLIAFLGGNIATAFANCCNALAQPSIEISTASIDSSSVTPCHELSIKIGSRSGTQKNSKQPEPINSAHCDSDCLAQVALVTETAIISENNFTNAIHSTSSSKIISAQYLLDRPPSS